MSFDGVKVFTATVSSAREKLGDAMSSWIASHPTCEIRDIIVTQSSDASFHCMSITVFYLERDL